MSAADPWRAAVETMRERAAALRRVARACRLESDAPRPRSDDDERDPMRDAIRADREAAMIEAMADAIAARLDG
jgi:hypothetical protein